MTASRRFAHVEVHPDERRLTVGGEPVAVGARAFDVLLALTERPGTVVRKQELLDAAWPGLVVEEHNLVVQIANLRKLMGQDVIATIPGRGYRFAAPGSAPPASGHAPNPVPAEQRDPSPVLPELLGRQDDLAALTALLREKRLITITGTGGIGKTRVARRLADPLAPAFDHGTALVEMASLTAPDLLSAEIARVLKLDGAAVASFDGLAAALAGKRMLLVLDNAEHLVDGVARLVRGLHERCPGLRLVVTSQVPLRVPDEVVYRLDPLALPQAGSTVDDAPGFAAVALFVERVRAAQRQFRLGTENVGDVVAICRQLDGVPLAIELAAARAPLLGTRQLAGALASRLSLLTRGRRGAPPRHESLRGALEWTHQLLGPVEQVVYRRLSIFVGGFTLDLAREVAADPLPAQDGPSVTIDGWRVVDALDMLVDLSLVTVDAGEAPRYRMLESPRLHALEKLAEAGEFQRVAHAHVRAMIGHFDGSFRDLWLMTDAEREVRYLREIDNLRAALDWASGTDGERCIAVTLGAASAWIWGIGFLAEGRARIDLALSCCDAQTSAASRASLWRARGLLHASFDPAEAARSYEQALVFAEALGDSLLLCNLWLLLARTRARQPDSLDAANQALARASALLDHGAPPRLRAVHADTCAFLLSAAGDYEGARRQFEAAAAHYRTAGASGPRIGILDKLADLAWARGDLDAAESGFVETLAEFRRSAATTSANLGVCLLNLAGVYVERGRHAQALEVAREGLPLMLAAGYASHVLDHLALRAALCGRSEDAARIAGHVDAVTAARGARRLPNEARARERLDKVLATSLAAERRDALLSEGRVLGEADACRIALLA